MARKPQGMHPEEIKARICIKWGTLTAFAKRIGRTDNAVSNTIRQPGYSVPIEREIAKDMNMLPHDVWPDRFLYDGTAVSFRSGRFPIADAPADQRRNGVAA
ncbi:helix-turn-helix domain-containing protein [Brytella acorum]|uniref:Helix-turn-helix domain-containing protein n=1 Tax=Brytella acorum TaxID=2959299 RepID=A0AA35UN33_9PROT|nr:helix-turn-helix domain-containing protein [Brytella acorum]CAI9120470.1 helix-turn-helix domain-containing protein [Brytella acorum]